MTSLDGPHELAVGEYAVPRVASSPRATMFAIPAERASTLGIAVVVGITAVMLLTGRSAPLTYAFPIMAVVLGALLFVYAPGRFVAWVLVLWMLSPFIRRVVDAQNGWNAQNPILLAPMLVSALCAVDLVRLAPRLTCAMVLPALLALASLTAGVAVGLTESAPMLVFYAGLTWAAPVLLGLHVVLHPERHDVYHRAIRSTLLLGVLALGVYGVLQFVSPPLWDRLWMIQSQMNSIGTPVPMRVRVFSTLNAPGPLAQFLSASLLILLADRSLWRWPALLAGTTIFLLSLARSAWLGFAVGFVPLITIASRSTRRAGVAMLAVAVLVISAINLAPLPDALDAMRTTITSRVTSLGDLTMDDSYRARQYLIPAVLADISDNPLGSGLGATLVGGARGNASSRLADQGLYLDNGILEIYLVLGWFGGTLFLVGTGLAAFTSFVSARRHGVGYGYVAAAVALLAQVVGGTIFAGVGGGMFWLATAMAQTAHTGPTPRVGPRPLATGLGT